MHMHFTGGGSHWRVCHDPCERCDLPAQPTSYICPALPESSGGYRSAEGRTSYTGTLAGQARSCCTLTAAHTDNLCRSGWAPLCRLPAPPRPIAAESWPDCRYHALALALSHGTLRLCPLRLVLKAEGSSRKFSSTDAASIQSPQPLAGCWLLRPLFGLRVLICRVQWKRLSEKSPPTCAW